MTRTENSDINLVFRPINDNDISEVSGLHKRVFSDYFLTHLGEHFLKLYYYQFVKRPGYGIVATEDSDKVIGFVVATPRPEDLYTRFYQGYSLTLAAIALQRFIMDPYVRKNILTRVVHIKRYFRSLIYSSDKNKPGKIDQGTMSSTRLLSIGVEPEYQRQGVAEKLVDELCGWLSKDGVRRIGLSVLANNYGAIKFYERTGWRVECITESSIYYYRVI